MYTPQTTFGKELFAALAPWQTDSLGIYCDAIGAMYDPWYTLVTDVGFDDGTGTYVPGYGNLFNPATCPYKDLPYLGQFVGVAVPPNASDATARALITAEVGMSRGTMGAIRSAIERNLSYPVWAPNTFYASGDTIQNAGTYYLVTTSYTSPATFNTTNLSTLAGPPAISTQYTLFERTDINAAPNAYQMLLIVRPEQLTPSGNATALSNAVAAVKPGGIIFNIAQSDTVVWSVLTGAWTARTGSWQNVG